MSKNTPDNQFPASRLTVAGPQDPEFPTSLPSEVQRGLQQIQNTLRASGYARNEQELINRLLIAWIESPESMPTFVENDDERHSNFKPDLFRLMLLMKELGIDKNVIDNEMKMEIHDIPLRDFRKERPKNPDREKQILDKIAARLKGSKDFPSGYRTTSQDEATQLVARFMEFQKQSGHAYGPIDCFREFIRRESETLLDVAIIKTATRWQMMQNGNINKGQDVAQMLFCDDSRTEKRLEEYRQKSPVKHLKGALLLPISAYLILGPVLVLLIVMKMRGWKIDTIEPVWLISLIPMLGGGIMGSMGHLLLKHPETTTRKHMSAHYDGMEVPTEVEQFARLAFRINDKLKKLEIMPDGEEKLEVLRELKTMVEEADKIAQTNAKLLSAPAADYARSTKPRIGTSIPMRIETRDKTRIETAQTDIEPGAETEEEEKRKRLR